MLKCTRWMDARRIMFAKMYEALRRAEVENPFLGNERPVRLTLLLGGVADGCSLEPYWESGFNNKAKGRPSQEKLRKKWAEPLFTYVAAFLDSVHMERNKCVWVHYNPTKSQISQGMAALSENDLGEDEDA